MIIKFDKQYEDIEKSVLAPYKEFASLVKIMNSVKYNALSDLPQDQCGICLEKHSANSTLYYNKAIIHICDNCKNEIVENDVKNISIKNGLYK